MVMTTQSVRGTIRHKLERQVAASVKARQLFSSGEHLLVAVSGGPDSVALLTALASLAVPLRLRLSALHVNYGLRGEESEEDARFVAGLCDELNVPLICERVDLSQLSKRSKGLSLQVRAREARYAAFRRAAAAVGAGRIVLGHTADDQAETVLMWMLRGTGASGLAGIRPMRDGMYVRPLLDVSRADVLSYLHAKGRAFRTDSSNLKPVYLRNRIRHEVMPLLKRFNPSLLETLTREAEILRDEDTCLDRWASEWMERQVHRAEDRSLAVPRAALLELPVALQRRVIRRALQQATGSVQGPAFGSVDAVLSKVVRGRSGSSLVLRDARAVREYEHVRFLPGRQRDERSPASHAGVPAGIPSTVVWPPTGQVIRLRFAGAEEGSVPAGRRIATFDADRFTHRLEVRSWRAGDVFQPRGMAGRRKKLQDYFSDIKLPREQRAGVPLLVAPEGILWIAGYRADHRFRVTPATTRIVVAEVSPAETDGQGKD
jgi:tRNA(Ile)-lysidine synthase